MDAKSRQTTYKCYWEIAQAADLTPDGQEFEESDARMPQKFVEEVRNWFQTREEWLLVFDGINLLLRLTMDKCTSALLPPRWHLPVIYEPGWGSYPRRVSSISALIHMS